jgi:hypothetical protein
VLGYFQSIIDLDPEVHDDAFKRRVSEPEPDRSRIPGPGYPAG